MVLTPRCFALLAVTLAAFTSTATADVWSTNPVEGTEWKIGAPVRFKWMLKPPTSKQDVVTIYLVGGDPIAYKRLATLGKNVTLGEHSLTLPEVPNVTCGSQCALEFEVEKTLSNGLRGDYYSHPFTISVTGDTVVKAAAGAATTADKSAPPANTPAQTAATPNGPLTQVESAAKGAQSGSTSAASSKEIASAVAAMTAAVVATTASLLFL
ncbi:hypothetical protein BGZ83_004966 [Gryganskiella cystojenkinii]|nr:hypothetical protein BGZ83_004966 [Gryganskiella cystojenkinii]